MIREYGTKDGMIGLILFEYNNIKYCIITENMLLYIKICYKETPYEKAIRAVFWLQGKNSRIQE